MSKLLTRAELEKRCQDLGADTTGEQRIQSVSGNRPIVSDFELHLRLMEAGRSARENKLLVVALIPAVASVVAPVVAWIAVAVGK
ncbi:hypothetical protein [Nitrosomonas sp.]|uniref:hypothetical protein n=1 Tax=Nitrosomonas sp. TaxID=42353 RepID=UPI0025F50AF8|nr:hypothetical protein [Nitrosomonas sp.]